MLAFPHRKRYTFGMEKTKLTIPYIIRNWKSLKVRQKRAILSVLLIAAALVLFLIALIVGIVSCSGKAEAEPAETQEIAPLPALLRAPDRTGEAADPNEPEDGDPNAEPDLSGLVLLEEPDDEPTGENQGNTESTTEYQQLKKHDKGEAVSTLQARLMELGYLEIEEPTDYFGSSTEYAVELFQRQHELKQDGVAGTETLKLLYSKDAQHYTLKEGAEGRDVKMLQEQLVDLGYLAESEVDRVYGSVTIEAVKAFQKRNGLSADGLAGEKTLEKLYSDEAKISKSLESKLKAEEKSASSSSSSKSTPKPSSKTTQKPGSKTTPKPTAKPTPTPKKETRIEKFIKAANSKIGCEYVLGDRGPKTFDCSGFVWYCLKQAGVSVNRLNASGFSKKASWKNISSINDIQKGDILFFRSDASSNVSHCGIYIGSGMMIDASSSNGKVVKRAVSSYWKRNFVNARRPW